MAIEWPEIVDRLIILSSPGGLQLFTLMPAQLGSQGYYTGDGPSMEKMRAYLEGKLYNKALLTKDKRYAGPDIHFDMLQPFGTDARQPLNRCDVDIRNQPARIGN